MTEEISKIGTGQPGRPTNEEGRKIEYSILQCFARGLSPAYTVQLTGLNKNTVYAKYKELEDGIREAQGADIAARSEARKLQHSLVTDDLLVCVYDMFKSIEKSIHEKLDSGTDVPAPLFNKFTDLLKWIRDMQNSKKVHVPEKFEFNGQVYER